MESFGRRSPAAVCLFAALALVLLAVPAEESYAQAEVKWLDVGDLANRYTSTGSYGLAGPGMVWPYLMGSTGSLHGYHDGFELWIGARDWTDEEGEEWPHKIAYTSRSSLGQSVFPQTFTTISKYPDTYVEVDLLEDYRVQTEIDSVDPSLPADRMILNEINTNLGIKLTKRIYAFSQEYHDDYHVIEMVLTNTGNVDNDEEVELPEQTVQDIYLWWDRRWGQSWKTSDVVARSTRWGAQNMHDIVRDADLRANYTWNGRVADFNEWDPIGAPAVESTGSSFESGQDTTGRLHSIGYASTFALHADQSTEDRSDDINQPVTMWWHDANAAQATGTNETNASQMEEHYSWFESGIADPFQAYEMEPDGDFAHQTNTQYNVVSQAGVRVAHAYGPYTLGPGESVRIVVGEAVAGLPYDAALEIGRKFKRLWEQGDQYGDIWYDANHDGVRQEEEVMDKNEWAIDAARDSVLHVIRRAMANYDSDFGIPQPPPPPTRFIVQSVAGGASMEWEYPYEDPAGGFEIYRAKNFFKGTVEDDYAYEKIAELDGSRRSYTDTSSALSRGLDYFYYLSAVGEVNDDPTGMTPTGTRLRSSRYYTQTYAPVTPQRTAGEALSDIRIVPNPFHVGASANLRYPGAERIGFLDIPGQCTIKIYTERGDLVKTIEHTDGTGDEYWNLQTEAQQMLASGFYIAAIEDHASGETVFEKFIIVR